MCKLFVKLYLVFYKILTSEQVVIPVDKPYITISGTQASTTILTWSQGNDIFKSPTLTIFASHFVARYITVQNTYGGKAVAMRVAGDKAAFYSCRFISYQDTILDDVGSHYFKYCYIEGATDFICGSGTSLYEVRLLLLDSLLANIIQVLLVVNLIINV